TRGSTSLSRRIFSNATRRGRFSVGTGIRDGSSRSDSPWPLSPHTNAGRSFEGPASSTIRGSSSLLGAQLRQVRRDEEGRSHYRTVERERGLNEVSVQVAIRDTRPSRARGSSGGI